MPKVTSENKKIYTNAGDVQTYTYTFDKEYEGVKAVNIVSSNKSFMNAVSDVNMMKVYVPENASGSKTQVSIELKEEATKCLKAGKYTFTMELLDEDGKALCKPVKATIKLEKLKKNLKYTAKYTMSNKDMSSVVMKYTGVACCADNGTPRLLNANIKEPITI